MKIATPKEIKPQENRVGLTPGSVRELVGRGHEVFIETGAGAGIGARNTDYETAGARILPDADAVFATGEMIVKVKEPQAAEVGKLRPHHTLFTYLHLAAEPALTQGLIDSGCTAIAYETVTDDHGGLPLLAPMSEVAGRMGAQVAAQCLEAHAGGKGLLMGGVPGTAPAKVVVLGGGMAGTNAARIAMGMGAEVTILEKSLPRMRALYDIFGGRIRLIHSTTDSIEAEVTRADVVVGAVLIPGATAPALVSREMVAAMAPGSVMVDIAIDQGGCFATSKPTTHAQPTYTVDGVVHYCVTNMPGAVPQTSTAALNAAVLPYAIALADKGAQKAMADTPHLARGLNVIDGAVAHPAVAQAHNLPLSAPAGAAKQTQEVAA